MVRSIASLADMLLDRVLSTTERREVLPWLRMLLTADRFHARGVVQTHGTIQQWHIEVDRPAKQWFAADDRGHAHEFRDGVTFRRGEPVEHPTSVWGELVGPLPAVFPERLRWWGESDHDFRPMLIERVGMRSHLLTFEHGADPSMRSTMVVDTDLGLVTRVMHFDGPYMLLLDVVPDRGVERITPESFPELDVVYADY